MNEEVFRLAMKHIHEFPEEHQQEVWAQRSACGTAACLAGRVVLQAGAEIMWDSNFLVSLCVTPSGERRHISQYARELLGIGQFEAEALFDHMNSVEDLEEIGEGILSGE